MNIVDHILENLMSHGDPCFEPHIPAPIKRRWFRKPVKSEPYIVDYVHPSGLRMPLTEAQRKVFVPIELDMIGSVDRYRAILDSRVRFGEN